ncbi:MAG: ATP synthase F1 subunit delta [Ignavibacteriae bacterium]|nr:ATP synthase F1 subunit delta [Ignavibacteriota bacterium]
MSDIRAAYRYALAMIDVAEGRNELDEVTKDIQLLDTLAGESREFFLFLKSPVVKTEKKKRVLTDLLKGKVSDATFKFVLLLVSKNREGLLADIIQQFYRLRDERLGIINVTVRTAMRFSDKQEKQLISQLERATKKKIRLQTVVDPSGKGGFVIQFEDTVWDASVKHQLELFKKRLVEEAA